MAGENQQSTSQQVADPGTSSNGSADSAKTGSTQNGTNDTSKQTTSTTGDQNKGAGEKTLLGGQGDAKTGTADNKTTEQQADSKLELKLPDGVDEKDPLVVGFKEVAGKVGLKSEQAQAIFDLYEQRMAAAAQQAVAERKTQAAEWQAAVRADKDIGGDKLEANLKLANAFIQKIGGPELGQVLEQSGLGNQPSVVKFIVKAARAAGEDSLRGTLNGSGKVANGDEKLLRELFPNSPSLFGEAKQQ